MAGYTVATILFYWVRDAFFASPFQPSRFLFRWVFMVILAAAMGGIIGESTRRRRAEVAARREADAARAQAEAARAEAETARSDAEAARAQAEAANLEKSGFLSRVSHELRT